MGVPGVEDLTRVVLFFFVVSELGVSILVRAAGSQVSVELDILGGRIRGRAIISGTGARAVSELDILTAAVAA